MVAEFPDFYESNMKLLKKNHLNAWKTIHESDSKPVGEIILTEDGKPNLKVKINENEFLFFHDTHNPEKESDDFLKIVPENAKGTVIFQGMGLGFGPLAIIEKREDIRHLIIFELSVGIFLQALRVMDLSLLLGDRRVVVFLGPDPDVNEIFAVASRSMRLEETSMLTHNPSCLYHKEDYEKLGRQIYNFANQLNISANTFKQFGASFIANRLSFLSMIHHTSLIDSLKGRFENIPAILVASGPSLDKNIDLLGEFKEKAIIISVDSALPALLAHGVTPDFVTSIDYQNVTYEKIASCAPKANNLSLICSSWVGQKVAKIFPADNIYWTFTGGAMENWINKGLGGHIVSPGAGTVAHLNFVAAVIMGCSPIIFTGQDLAFSKNAGEKDHALHTVLGSNDETSNLLKNQAGLIWVDANNGGKVPTSRAFMNFLDQFEKMIASTPGKYINATEGGAFIKGTEVMLLNNVLDQFCNKNLNISEKMKKCGQESRIGNIQGFLSEIKSVLKLANEMDRLVGKSDELSNFLKKRLLKLQISPQRYSSFDALPQDLQKKVAAFDQCHHKLDKKQGFWEIFDEATVNALQTTDRMKHEINKLQDIPGKYIAWLLENLKRLGEVNRVRKDLIRSFSGILLNIVEHHKSETKFLKAMNQSGKDGSNKNKIEEMMGLARLYFESGNLALAKPILSEILTQDTDNAEACFYLGEIAAQHTEYEKSDAFFKKAVDHKSEFKEKIEAFKKALGDEYFSYAVIFWHYDKASSKRMILKGLKFCPGHARLIVELSAILTKDMEEIDLSFQSDNKESENKIIREWIEIFRTQPELETHIDSKAMALYYKTCGKIFLVAEEDLKAFENFHRSLFFQKDDPESYILLADLMQKMGKKEQAETYLGKAMEMDQAYVREYIKAEEKNKEDENRKASEKCRELIIRGNGFLIQRAFQDALECYREALTLDKNNADAVHNMGKAFHDMGELDKAVACYEKAIGIEPAYYSAYYNMGIAVQEMGQIARAISLFRKTLALQPVFTHAWNNLGNACNQAGQPQEAIQCFTKVLEIDPGYADAFNNLGLVYQSLGMPDQAELNFKAFLKIKSDRQ